MLGGFKTSLRRSCSPDAHSWLRQYRWQRGQKLISEAVCQGCDEGGNRPRRVLGRIGLFAGQNVGVKQVNDRVWLVSFMDYDLGFFDDETCRLEPAVNPFGAKVLPMSPE